MAAAKPPTPDELRSQLQQLGERRAEQEASEDELMKDVENVLSKAYGIIPVSEAARLLGMHRTTVYRVYHPHAA